MTISRLAVELGYHEDILIPDKIESLLQLWRPSIEAADAFSW
ncbi:MAG: hypothetical protein AB7F20_05645 [Geoalkalibacter sp.]